MHFGDFGRHLSFVGREDEPKTAEAFERGLRQSHEPRLLSRDVRIARIGRRPGRREIAVSKYGIFGPHWEKLLYV